jgi:NAD(P)-dependent dehydrogenase (short-subunit alcohol dehydrogenase family)
VLVNNAGISGPFDPVTWGQDPTTMDLDDLRRVVDTNVYGVIRVTNAMLPMLRRSEHPRIVNTSSSMGSLERQPGPVMGVYSSSKTFLNGITVQYARAFQDTPVIVNAACPGLVATDFNGFAGDRSPEQGAATAVRLATLPDDGPRGGFFDDGGVVPW